MDNREYCCIRQAIAHNQRQIVWSNDGDGSWNVAVGPIDEYVLEDILYCPYCGERLPEEET
jgi:hypothetical protein